MTPLRFVRLYIELSHDQPFKRQIDATFPSHSQLPVDFFYPDFYAIEILYVALLHAFTDAWAVMEDDELRMRLCDGLARFGVCGERMVTTRVYRRAWAGVTALHESLRIMTYINQNFPQTGRATRGQPALLLW